MECSTLASSRWQDAARSPICRTTRARAVRRSMNSSCVGKPCVAFGPATAHRRPESRTHNARECEGARRLQAMKSKDRSVCADRAACSTARHGMHTFHLLGDHLAMPVAVHAQCTHHGGGLRGEQRLSQGEGNKARFGACARGHALAPTERHVTVHRNVKHAWVSIARGKTRKWQSFEHASNAASNARLFH